MIKYTLKLLLFVLATFPSFAATYYIDFATGDNLADGLSPQSAWKHAPLDSQADGNPAMATLAPGDILRFRGGVAYHGSLRIKSSGTDSAPIILNGNADGEWGEGPAILDGGRVITGWQPVETAEEVGGNPNWRNILRAEVDADIEPNVSHDEIILHRKQKTERQAPWQRVFLIDGKSGLLPVAQFPKPEDPFFPDLPRDFFEIPDRLELDEAAGRTRIQGGAILNGLSLEKLEGAFAGFWAGNNHTYFGRILDLDAETGTLELPLYKGGLYKTSKFALYNSPALISEPGEWAVVSRGPSRTHIYLMAPEGSAAIPENLAYPELETGILINGGASHIAIKGFLIKRYAGGEGGISVARSRERSKGIQIENCEIRNLTGMGGIMLNYCDDISIRNNRIHHNPGWTVGIFMNRVNRFELVGNHLTKNAGSGIRHYECTDGRILENHLMDHHGIHSSGMNFYEGTRDVLVENNFLTDVIAINRSAERLTLRNNIIDSRNIQGFCIAFWGSGSVGGHHIEDVVIENNTLIRPAHTAVFIQTANNRDDPANLVFRRNIIAAVNKAPEGSVFEDNIFLKEPRFVLPESNIIVPDLSQILHDPVGGDYTLKTDLPISKVGASGEFIFKRKP